MLRHCGKPGEPHIESVYAELYLASVDQKSFLSYSVDFDIKEFREWYKVTRSYINFNFCHVYLLNGNDEVVRDEGGKPIVVKICGLFLEGDVPTIRYISDVGYDKNKHIEELRAKIKALLKRIDVSESAVDIEVLILDLLPLLDEHPDGLDKEPLLVESLLHDEVRAAKLSGDNKDLNKVKVKVNQILQLTI